jgi:hypothetical protein
MVALSTIHNVTGRRLVSSIYSWDIYASESISAIYNVNLNTHRYHLTARYHLLQNVKILVFFFVTTEHGQTTGTSEFSPAGHPPLARKCASSVLINDKSRRVFRWVPCEWKLHLHSTTKLKARNQSFLFMLSYNYRLIDLSDTIIDCAFLCGLCTPDGIRYTPWFLPAP